MLPMHLNKRLWDLETKVANLPIENQSLFFTDTGKMVLTIG